MCIKHESHKHCARFLTAPLLYYVLHHTLRTQFLDVALRTSMNAAIVLRHSSLVRCALNRPTLSPHLLLLLLLRSAPDIQRQLPLESKSFLHVDKQLREIMRKTKDRPNALQVGAHCPPLSCEPRTQGRAGRLAQPSQIHVQHMLPLLNIYAAFPISEVLASTPIDSPTTRVSSCSFMCMREHIRSICARLHQQQPSPNIHSTRLQAGTVPGMLDTFLRANAALEGIQKVCVCSCVCVCLTPSIVPMLHWKASKRCVCAYVCVRLTPSILPALH
jgi:hypothetical protein